MIVIAESAPKVEEVKIVPVLEEALYTKFGGDEKFDAFLIKLMKEMEGDASLCPYHTKQFENP